LVGINDINIGTEYRLTDLHSKLKESQKEVGEETLLSKPTNDNYNLKFNLNSLSFFAEDNISISNNFNANIGIRLLKYEYSNENLISPRVTLSYRPSLLHNFTFSWGYYYQPPFINELRGARTNSLKSQEAIHYVLGWEYLFKEKLKLKVEIYYKDLQNIIPFYFDEFKMVYREQNSREGFAAGLDVMVEGELVDGMKSWFGYSYLDTQERRIGDANYQRRLFDQTHTLQIFLQDKMGKHQNWQSHLRFLVGSGFLYYNRFLSYSHLTKTSRIEINFNNPNEYLFFFRVDMGLSANFDMGNGYKIVAVAEILNVFNRYNAGAYQWVQALREIKAPINIPHILSKRFLNLRMQFVF
ncbi:MAG: TonB-dependent receptor, partial [Melioribacteraceae bacterium]